MRETAKRAKISVSKAYAIVNGDNNVEFDTFENIATAFSMSPAELAVAIGKGRPDDDPELAPIHARLRQIPRENLGMVERLIATFVPPTNAKTHPSLHAKTSRAKRIAASEPDEHGPDNSPTLRWPWSQAILSPAGA